MAVSKKKDSDGRFKLWFDAISSFRDMSYTVATFSGVLFIMLVANRYH
jgi:hypothetical protein